MEKFGLTIENNELNNVKTLMNTISSYFDEISENYYDIIPEEEKLIIDCLQSKFDVHFSGTTCVLVFRIGQKIICSNEVKIEIKKQYNDLTFE